MDHHDKAYAWAERRKLETHPATGAAQLVEVRESVVEIAVPRYVQQEFTYPVAPTAKPLFPNIVAEQMLAYGAPREWVADAMAATKDSLFGLAEHLHRACCSRRSRLSWLACCVTNCVGWLATIRRRQRASRSKPWTRSESRCTSSRSAHRRWRVLGMLMVRRLRLVKVAELDIMRIANLEAKADAPLIVDAVGKGLDNTEQHCVT